MTAWRTEWRTEWIKYPGYDVHRVGRGHVAPTIDERTMNRASALRYRVGLSALAQPRLTKGGQPYPR
jgi:hypothetical protein